MRILLTGASGFIGNRVLKLLLKENFAEELIALSSKDTFGIRAIDAKGYEFDENYLIKNGCKEIDTILHIGAWIPKNIKDANNLSKSISNILSTYKLLDSQLPNLKRIVFISTIDVYQDSDLITENTWTIPETIYGWSKLYCEKLIKEYCVQHDCIAQILRLGHVYGEGEEAYKKVIPVMIQNIIDGQDIHIYGDGTAKRTYIYIDDVAQAIIKSLLLEKTETINIVGNEMVTINDLAEYIRQLSKKNIRIKHLVSDMPNRNCVFDNSKMKSLLLSTLVPLKEGLKKEYGYMEGLIDR